MKQKYLILKGEDKKSIIIKEFAELDKDMLSLLCEETYDIKGIKTAVSGGKDAVVSAIRTSNMYPAGVYAEKIADSIITLYKSKDQDFVEVYFDDFDLISAKRKKAEAAAEAEAKAAEESAEIDDLIEDDDKYDEDFDEKTSPIKKIDSSIKVEDDDSAEYEEDV
jgi:hypothetical protein